MYMKKLLLIMLMLVAVSTSSTTVVAQARGGNQDREERLFIAKMKVIQEELKLDEEQTEKFAVIYRKYDSEMRKLFKKRYKRKTSGELTTAQALKMTNDHIDMKIDLLKLQKAYYKQYANVLTPEQLLRLDRAEQRIQFEIMKQGKNRKDRPRRHNNNND